MILRATSSLIKTGMRAFAHPSVARASTTACTRSDLHDVLRRHKEHTERRLLLLQDAQCLVRSSAEDQMSNLGSMEAFLQTRTHGQNSMSVESRLAEIQTEKAQVLSDLDTTLEAAKDEFLNGVELVRALDTCQDVLLPAHKNDGSVGTVLST